MDLGHRPLRPPLSPHEWSFHAQRRTPDLTTKSGEPLREICFSLKKCDWKENGKFSPVAQMGCRPGHLLLCPLPSAPPLNRVLTRGSLFPQSAVKAATAGRVLVLEGIEKAERNVLPVLNNLLENREMQLDDGRFLMHPARYDKLLQVSQVVTVPARPKSQ